MTDTAIKLTSELSFRFTSESITTPHHTGRIGSTSPGVRSTKKKLFSCLERFRSSMPLYANYVLLAWEEFELDLSAVDMDEVRPQSFDLYH